MFRGFRWQLVAAVLGLAVFLGAAVFRFSRARPPAPLPEPTLSLAVTSTASSAPSNVVAQPRVTPAGTMNGLYREAMAGSVERLNPLFAHLNPADRDITSLIFEGLFAFNEYGETVPLLATELIISGDGLEYVVRLRDDIRWHDGVPFSADDVVYTASLLSDPMYAEYSRSGVFWQSVETQKLRQDLVRFRLAQPFSSFPILLSIGLLPEHALRGTNVAQLAAHPFNLSPIGTGAYQLAALDTEDGQSVTGLRLALSPTYRQRPEAQTGYFLRHLRFQFSPEEDAALATYIAGDADAISGIVPSADADARPQSAKYRQLESALSVLIFNWTEAPFEERRVRQALSLGLDMPQLVESRFGSAASYADSPYVPGSSVYQPQGFWTTYDPAQARTLLSAPESEAVEDEDGEVAADPAQVHTLIVEDGANARGLANDIVAQWRLLGFDFVVEALDADTLRNRLESGRFDAAIITQRLGADPDLFRFWHPSQHGSGYNFGAVSDNEIAELLEIARAENYAARRALLYQRLQEIFAEQTIAIPLYYPVYTFVARNNIDGIQLGYLTSPADRYRGIRHWRPVGETS